ncbi:MAG TPA: transcriptional repressor LexA [Patescibacteria group bacterium]
MQNIQLGKNLTAKQRRVYSFVCDFIESRGISPTVTEIAQHLGVSSLRTVTQYLESLQRKNLITRLKHQSRGIRLLNQAGVVPQTITLPVVSSAGCDNLSVFAEENYDEYITLDKDFLGGKNPSDMVAVKAVGDSMVDAGISSGDLVLTEKTFDIAEKDNVVAVVDGMAVIKQIRFTPNAIILHPMSHDPQYRPIIMKKDFQVFGKVIDVIKGFGGEELVYEKYDRIF